MSWRNILFDFRTYFITGIRESFLRQCWRGSRPWSMRLMMSKRLFCCRNLAQWTSSRKGLGIQWGSRRRSKICDLKKLTMHSSHTVCSIIDISLKTHLNEDHLLLNILAQASRAWRLAFSGWWGTAPSVHSLAPSFHEATKSEESSITYFNSGLLQLFTAIHFECTTLLT